MRSERDRGHKETRHRRDHAHHTHGAKTFRRGRAIAFLERMELKRSTIKKQLEMPELQTINPILVGELKAIDMVIDEFMQVFELYEFVEEKTDNEGTEGTGADSLLNSKNEIDEYCHDGVEK